VLLQVLSPTLTGATVEYGGCGLVHGEYYAPILWAGEHSGGENFGVLCAVSNVRARRKGPDAKESVGAFAAGWAECVSAAAD
jgi:hypothetical protein